jgi:reactive intermediate/imine deaminase
MTHEVLNSPELGAPVGVFVQARRVAAQGHVIYVSGLTSRAPDSSVVGVGDIRAQTRQVLENLKTILATAGATLDDVVRVVVYVRDMNHFKEIHEVRAQYFTKTRPASTMVEVSRLVHPDQLIEIEATAYTQDS